MRIIGHFCKTFRHSIGFDNIMQPHYPNFMHLYNFSIAEEYLLCTRLLVFILVDDISSSKVMQDDNKTCTPSIKMFLMKILFFERLIGTDI